MWSLTGDGRLRGSGRLERVDCKLKVGQHRDDRQFADVDYYGVYHQNKQLFQKYTLFSCVPPP